MRTTIHVCGRARMLGAIVLLALLTLTRPALAAPKPLTKAEQERIDAAIQKGVDYLRRTQRENGTWKQEDKIPARGESVDTRLGYDFLVGLALLECGVPASDPGIQKIAAIVRKTQPSLDATYVVSLAILFLDRLGDAKNEDLLQSLAVRLLAAQCREGGWDYFCPSVSPRHEKAILETLRKLWPPAPVSGSSPKDAVPAGRDNSRADAADLIPPSLRILTVFQSVHGVEAPKSKRPTYFDVAYPENVATHFALMALWTARRHGVPVDQSLRLLADYFKRSQFADGTWPYRYRKGSATSQRPRDYRGMICTGLIGLATGHALQPGAAKSRPEIRDPRVLKSFALLSREVGRPSGDMTRRPKFHPGLYFLWMVQQTAQAYGLEAISDKDWYRWGAECLLTTQTPKGRWPHSRYERVRPGQGKSALVGTTTTTAVALLFLKRYDPYRPLSKRIRLDPKQLIK